MKLQILHAPIVPHHACIPAYFKLGMQTPPCIIASIRQYLLCYVFPNTRLTVGLEANHHQICHGLMQLTQTLSPPWFFIDHWPCSAIHQCLLLETNRLHITVMVLSIFSPTYHHGLSSINH